MMKPPPLNSLEKSFPPRANRASRVNSVEPPSIITNGHVNKDITPATHSPFSEVPPKIRPLEPNGISYEKPYASNTNSLVSKHYDIDIPPVTEVSQYGSDKIVKEKSSSSGSQPQQSSKKIQNVLTRTLWTFIMISGFLRELCYSFYLSRRL